MTKEEQEKANKEKHNASNKRWRAQNHYKSINSWRLRNREKHLAQQKLEDAVYRGRIKKPSCCSACGIKCNPHGHHEDYSKAREVIWLCAQCHSDVHRRARRMT